MFWYKRETLDSLIRLGASLTIAEKDSLQSKCDFLEGYKLAFNKKDRFYLEDNELLYIEKLIDVCSNDDILEKINGALCDSQLFYENGTVFNLQGACAIVQEERIGEDILIRKRTRERDISNEFHITNLLNKNSNNGYVINVISNSFDGKSYLMETASESLETYIENNPGLVIQKRLEIVQRLLDCVEFVHSYGIVHRDLHPGNMLLIRQDTVDVWKLSDFGFACKIEEIANNGEEIDKSSYGRPDYAAPEQLKSLSNTSVQSDIYSIGKLINFIMTNSCKKNSHILHDIVEHCCRKEPSKRFFSIAAIKAELQQKMPYSSN